MAFLKPGRPVRDMTLKEKIETYVKERMGPEARLEGVQRLGEGIHGEAYAVAVRQAGQVHRIIVKTLFPSGFGHDHYSDRAQVLLLAHAGYNELDRHIRSIDVVAETPDRLVSVGEATEFYIFMEEARGQSYFTDLNAILKRGRLEDGDMSRARLLSDVLLDIHARKYEGKDGPTLYRRRIRDLVGHGECVMGIVDAYGDVAFTDERELVAIAGKCLAWWGRIRNRSNRLRRVHGDYHPGNIWFKDGGLTLLDRSRGSWGDAADDVSCLGLNYVYYAIKDRGTFDGPFADLFRAFLDRYLQTSGDGELLSVVQPFFAFRALVVANPAFYPDDTKETKRKLLNFGLSVLDTDVFETEKVGEYIRGQ